MNPPIKLTDLRTAVARFVPDGAIIGVGGQNISRCAIAIAQEIIRQRRRDLTLVGCNLSLHADLLVGAGAVRRCECGTVNLERFGIAYQIQQAIESGSISVEDYDHLSMISRFTAAELGVPFLPVRNLLGSSLLESSCASTGKKIHLLENPWSSGEQVVLVPALRPTVSIIHAQRADVYGNIVINGPLSHEPEMIRGSHATIVTCEEILPDRIDDGSATISHHYISAVIDQPFGAHPTGVFGLYLHDDAHIRSYQRAARTGGACYRSYLEEYVYGCADFSRYLTKIGGERLASLARAL